MRTLLAGIPDSEKSSARPVDPQAEQMRRPITLPPESVTIWESKLAPSDAALETGCSSPNPAVPLSVPIIYQEVRLVGRSSGVGH